MHRARRPEDRQLPWSDFSTTTQPRRIAMATPKDAIALLRADHKAVDALFKDYESARRGSQKQALVKEICVQLTAHAQIEEEIFYPAVQKALRDKELVPEARVEHATMKSLIAQIEDVAPDGELYEAKVMVLGEYVRHHVKEEQNELFPKVKETRLDLVALGEQLAARKRELLEALQPV
jgi:hemerythrin superfamily protein